jgi:regulator of CtrA degradation
MKTVFFRGTYDEAFQLLLEARDYLAHLEPSEGAVLTPKERLAATQEATRLTARLLQVMAWLLVRRAVQEGEMSFEDALHADRRLDGQGVCLTQIGDKEAAPLPRGLKDLLGRSYRLYARVDRLDKAMGPTLGGTEISFARKTH